MNHSIHQARQNASLLILFIPLDIYWNVIFQWIFWKAQGKSPDGK